MRRTSRLVPALCVILIAAAAAAAGEDGKTFSLGNTRISRSFVLEDGVWRTVSFGDGTGKVVVPVKSDEFVLRLMDGTELTAADYRAEEEGIPETRAPESGCAGRVAVVSYALRPGAPDGAPRRVIVRYGVRDNEAWIRKSLLLEMKEGEAVDRLVVERFRTSLPCSHGGKGEPVFIGSRFFTGLEYPAAEALHEKGLVTLAHYPGYARKDALSGRFMVKSKTAVAAVAPRGLSPRLFFNDYLDTIRVPPRNFLQYNSWYDLRGREVNPARLLEICRGYKKNLAEPYGVRLDALVPDDGFQERDSLWVPRKADFPGGLAGLRRAVEGLGSRLGIWCPLNGFNLNTAWGEARGLERASVGGRKKNYYCLAGKKYGAAIREALRRLIAQGNLGYMKHDFNFLECDAPGHGHLPDRRHGREANLDAELDLLAFERDVQPDIFLNVTSCVWHSPWWLMYADTIWMCAGDLGFNDTWPQISSRACETSYRDIHFHKVILEEKHLVPVSAYMTHGIILGNYARVGGPQETVRDWSDAVTMYYGRGVQLKELYVNPDLLKPKWWRALGETTRWAVENAPALERVALFGGRPDRGETYGYMHWKGERGILVARNPDVREQDLPVPFDQTVGFRGSAGAPYHGRVIYPFFEEMPGEFRSGKAIDLPLPGDGVMAFEFLPGPPLSRSAAAAPPLEGWKAEKGSGPGRLVLRIPVPDEDMPLCAVRLVIRGAVLPEGAPNVKVETAGGAVHGDRKESASAAEEGEGTPGPDVEGKGRRASIPARAANGPDWSLREIDLRPWRGKEAVVTVESPGGCRALFTPSFTLSAWFIADRAVVRPDPPEGIVFPRLIAQRSVRQTLPLAEGIRFHAPEAAAQRLTAGDLAGVQAAKLRLFVFDVNGGPHFGRKAIFLNGRKLAKVPPNTRGLSVWQEKMIDLSKEQLRWIRLENTLRFDNADGDYYKVKGLALAVQLEDGEWVRTAVDGSVYSSVVPWAFAEGRPFEKGLSPEIPLDF